MEVVEVEVEVDEEDEVIVETEIRMELNIVTGEIVKRLLEKEILCLKILMFLVNMKENGLVLDLVH
ncbi:hypothetical protein IJ913_01880 [bacterium]|nr:hypothetical protein [bacterium]